MAAAQSSASWPACNPNLARTIERYRHRWSRTAVALAHGIKQAEHLTPVDWFEMLDCIEVVLRPILASSRTRTRAPR